jgi:UDP-N-acetylmuramoylalanine--D-glutamate ligase
MKVGCECAERLGQPLRVAVFGAGVSGRAVARRVIASGGDATLFDAKAADAEPDLLPDAVAAYDVFVFSPGIPPRHPWRQLVSQQVSPDRIYGEVGFGLKDWSGSVLGVTGTNGKTTVTLLLESLLRVYAKGRVRACGNIGKPCVEAVMEVPDAGPDDWLVVEISSFQAMDPNGIRLDGLIWTNFAPDHLDYHGSEAEYFAAKAALLDTLVDGAPLVTDTAVDVRLGRFLRPDQRQKLSLNVVDGVPLGSACPRGLPAGFKRMPQLANIMQSTKLLSLIGCSPNSEEFETVLATFESPPHRLHVVATVEGVGYWNDSKATNPHAALSAIGGFSEPVCWLAGGRNKGIDLKNFARDAARNLPAGSCVITTGESGQALAEALRDHQVEVENCIDPHAIAQRAHACAKAKGLRTVVFSPGFASFDSFSSYADRGKNFISQVLCLMASV